MDTAKLSLNKLESEEKFNRIRDLPIHWYHCSENEKLPWLHRDPFDRLLICQAMTEDLVLISKDRKLREYPVSVVW